MESIEGNKKKFFERAIKIIRLERGLRVPNKYSREIVFMTLSLLIGRNRKGKKEERERG